MKIQALFLGLVLSLFPCLQSNAITYGEPDGQQHPYVGVIVFLDAGGSVLTSCSGTLMNSTVVLTAGHCTFGASLAYVWFQEIVPSDFSLPFYTGTPIAHPGFDDFATFPNTSDVGVVALHEAVLMDEYGSLPSPGLLDSLSTTRGRQDRLFTVVGYGLDVLTPLDYPLLPPEFVERRVATSMLVNLRSALTDGYNLQTSNHPGSGLGSGGNCKGDSGGPVLLGDTNIVVGIISFGQNGLCRGVDFSYRTDIDNTLDFLDLYLP